MTMVSSSSSVWEPSPTDLDLLADLHEELIDVYEPNPRLYRDKYYRSIPRSGGKSGNIGSIIKAFGKWAGSHHACVAKLSSKGFEDPNALCAWLRDRYEGTTLWRGKGKDFKSKHKKATEILPAEKFREAIAKL